MNSRLLCGLLIIGLSHVLWALEPLPKKLVVLTFDDSVASHATVVAPLLKKYGFGATFFITEGFTFRTNKQDYMTWEQIAQLHRDGFEIGNHTRDHLPVSRATLKHMPEQLAAIDSQCAAHGIPKPITFAYPGNATDAEGLQFLRDHGIKLARRGGAPEFPYDAGRGVAYEPGVDHPLLIPSAGDARPYWNMEDFKRAVKQSGPGKVIVLQFHGVPDRDHPWVHTPPEIFEQYLKYLKSHGYQVVAMRELLRYVDPDKGPKDPFAVIKERKGKLTK